MTRVLMALQRLPRDFPVTLVFLATLALTFFAYSPGLGGSFHFDDEPNLAGLARVADIPTALRFVTEGVAGPLGRPLALASFVPQFYGWPDAPDVFLYVNVCIHLLNGVLLVWALYLISSARGIDKTEAAWLATFAGAIWMLLPILASSSLLVVQRMTTLSASFLLLGLIGYLMSRRLSAHRPRTALALMTGSLVVGSALATLAKENGALLPIFVLILELTLLPRPFKGRFRTIWTAWSVAVLLIPAALLTAYLVYRADYPDHILAMREFSSADRLLTQAHVLWQYLYHAFLPTPSAIGPFHDDYPVHRDWLTASSLLATGGWLAVIGSAVALRRRAPVFLFAVAWYLVGHSLESTTIPLELYFEHRNYVPLIGPVLALVSVVRAPRLPQPLLRGGLAAYALTLAVVLFSTTSLWGRPALAAEVWFKQHPDSTRAVQYLGRQLNRAGYLQAVHRVMSDYAAEHPRSSATALQALVFSCVLEPSGSHDERIDSIKANLPNARFEYGVFGALEELYRIAANDKCDSVDRSEAYRLTAEVAAHSRFVAVPKMQHNLHLLMSEEAVARGNLDLTMHHLETALASHYTMTTLVRAVRLLVSAGLYSTALDFVKDAYEREPAQPVRAARWQQQLASLEAAIQAAHDD